MTTGPSLSVDEVDDLEDLLEFVREQRGFDFTSYKRPTLERRFAKRMEAVGVASAREYAERLATDPDEYLHLFNTILINVTSFFRDAPAWEYVRDEIVPRILDAKADDDPIRLWSTGCASGQEAYSLAMVFAEALGESAFRERVKVYATDLDDDALTEGRHAVYTAKDLEPVPENLRARYFEPADGARWSFRQDLRRSVIFGKHDLLQDPPISRVGLLASRNTLMYFAHDAQTRILGNFHFALNREGYLFLGKSEMLLTRSRVFTPVNLKRRVFAKEPVTDIRRRLQDLAAGDGDGRVTAPVHHPEELLIRQASLEAGPVAQIIVDEAGMLAFANAHARRLFGLGPGDLGRPLQDLELSYRPVELRSQIEQVQKEHHPVVVRDVEWRVGADRHWFEVHVGALAGVDGTVLGTAIAFTDVTRYRRLQDSFESSRERLETAYEELQSTAEELETTNEELQSTNEELETTNEELQSTNEELETMNEELQSTNEELETINDELRVRTDDLNQVNAFLESILSSLRSAVVVVDDELRVRAWNEHARELWGLTADEVDGQHILNLDIGLPVEHVVPSLRACLANEPADPIVVDATNRRGRAVRVTVSCSALFGASGEIRGVIVQMLEATE